MAILACSIGGCGTGGYTQNYEATANKLRHEEKFRDLWETSSTLKVEGADWVAKIRLPKFIDGKWTRFEKDNPTLVEGQDIDPAEIRAQPPFIRLAGYQFSYERYLGEDNSGFPIYIYLCAKDLSTGEQSAADQLASELNFVWEAIECETPKLSDKRLKYEKETIEGVEFKERTVEKGDPIPIRWRRSKNLFEQDFEYKLTEKMKETTKEKKEGDFEEGPVTVPGRFDAYVYHDKTKHLEVLIVWRIPERIEKKITELAEGQDLDTLTKACAGTLKFEDAPPEAKKTQEPE